MNRHAEEIGRASAHVRGWVLALIAVLLGFRFAVYWYNGESVTWGFVYTALAALIVFIAVWRWGRGRSQR
jgi:hypothetical protein